MLTVYNLQPGVVYRVTTGFTDYHQGSFTPGELLTYETRHFLPYHGGHTIVFRERAIYLQEEEQAELVNSLGRFLVVHGSAGPQPPPLPPEVTPRTGSLGKALLLFGVAVFWGVIACLVGATAYGWFWLGPAICSVVALYAGAWEVRLWRQRY